MTPPDSSSSSLTQDSIRLRLEQIRSSRNSLSPASVSRQMSMSSPSKHYNLVSKNFSSPTNILPAIHEQKIMLECLYTKDSTAYGTVRVDNCSYEKCVFVRVTQDEWATFTDTQAWHSMNHPNDRTDAFTFEISIKKCHDDTEGPKRVLFAVCLQSMGQEFWDSNQSRNYVLDVFER